jgi:hypothetical protein
LAAAARALPNLADLEVYHARLPGGVSTPLTALTRLRLECCSCPEGGAALRLDAPRLQKLDAEDSEAGCISLVAGHPTVRELVVGDPDAACRGVARALSDHAPSLRALAKLKVLASHDAHGGDGDGRDVLTCLLGAALRLPPALRSLDVTLVKSRVDNEAPRLDELLAMLGCAVGGRLQELSLVLKSVGPAEAASSRNPLLLVPAFPRLEALRLGCWHDGSNMIGSTPADDALALLGPLVQPLAAARALTPSLRAVELVLSDKWQWGPAQNEGVAGLERANPGLTVTHAACPFWK